MAQITSYSTLSTAINDYAGARSESQDAIDIMIGLAEAEFNLVPWIKTYRRETTNATLTTASTGIASLPSGFIRMRSIVRDYTGAAPLIPVSWEQLQHFNPNSEAGSPTHYAISGTSLKVAEITEDDFFITYETALSGLTSGNPTNWLITLAPNAYLNMCLSYFWQRSLDEERMNFYRAQAIDALTHIGIQSDLAQYGNSQIELDQAIP